MSIAATVRMWRWPAFLLVVFLAIVGVLVFRDEAFYLPAADGNRYVRQFAVAWMPNLGAVLLIDPTPEITATLPRTRSVYLALRAAMGAAVFLPLSLAWSVSDQPIVQCLYEIFITGVLITSSIIAVSWWHASGVLAASLVSVIWLLAGDTLALIFGFADITGAAMQTTWLHHGLAAASLVAALTTIARGAGATRWQ